jgi:four helix bundle protein
MFNVECLMADGERTMVNFQSRKTAVLKEQFKIRPNPIREKSYQFALKIMDLCKTLRQQKEYELSGQLFRSGTSIGANVEEASAGQTKKDFTAKMAIASKEARETNYWLRLLRDGNICTGIDVAPLIEESKEMVRMLTAIVKTAQTKDDA